MRITVASGTIAVGMLVASCTIAPYPENAKFSSPIFDDFKPRPERDRFPIVLTYPDNTMYFYPIFESPPRADLALRGMVCSARKDGRVLLTVEVQNQGADIVPAIELLTGDRGSFRVLATVTATDGYVEQVDAVFPVPLVVNGVATLRLSPTWSKPNEIARIDVVADPDNIVPDPIRDNNVVTWRGALTASNCPQR